MQLFFMFPQLNSAVNKNTHISVKIRKVPKKNKKKADLRQPKNQPFTPAKNPI